MNTKRCPDCQKLLRAEAATCNRCGHLFAEISRRPKQRPAPTTGPLERSGPGSRPPGSHPRTRSIAGQRTVIPASPHRAGHYAGLHPEDQPYQSAILSVRDVLEFQAPPEPAQADVESLPPAGAGTSIDDMPTFVNQPRPREHTPVPPFLPERRRPKRLVPVVLTIFCLLLLVGGSFTAYALLNKRPTPNRLTLTAMPNQLRVTDTLTLLGKGFGPNDQLNFIHDKNQPLLDGNGKPLAARADDRGAFSVTVAIPANWSVGPHSIYAIDVGKLQSLSAGTTITVDQSSLAPPQLALAPAQLNLGAAGPGVISKQIITLINDGGRQVVWQASSDQPWLSISPASGTFSGRSIATVSVNRGALAPQPSRPYTGHITFIQQDKSKLSLTMTVSMIVKQAPPASLTVSTVSLSYLGSQVANPAPQPLTLQNTSSAAIDWSSAIITGNGVNWLSISPSKDHLAAHSSETVMVSVQSQGLAPGSYNGTIGFNGGTNPVVSVALSVVAPGNLVASPPSLTFSAVGQNPPTQVVTLQNSGGAPVAWTLAASTVDGAKWLVPSLTSGSVPPGVTEAVTVAINATSLAPRSYQGMLTFNYGGGARQVPVSLTVSVPPSAAIRLSQSGLSFSTIRGYDPSPQSFAITNSGNAVLHWATSEDQGGSAFAPVSPASGTLNPAQSATITVSPSVSNSSAGTLSTTITIYDSDSGTRVSSQRLGVTIVIKDQAMISLSLAAMDFSQSSDSPTGAQILTITNTGSQDLNWTSQSSVSWLTTNVTGGTIASGDSAVINVQCDATGLSPGTYTGILTISDSDSGTPVAPQTLTVTLTVS